MYVCVLLDYFNSLAVCEANDIDALLEAVNASAAYSVDALHSSVVCVYVRDGVGNVLAKFYVSRLCREFDEELSFEFLVLERTIELNLALVP